MSSSFVSPSSYMNTTTLGQNMRVRQDIAALRSRLNEANAQLASGFKATTHGGLGASATVAQELRHKYGRIEGYRSSIALSQSRLTTVQASLKMVQERNEAMNTLAMTAWSPGSAQQIEQARSQAGQNLSSMVSGLNAYHGGRYLFSGSDVSTEPVADASVIVNGGSGKMGLRDVIALRQSADFGAGGDGRVSTSLAGSTVTVTHDGGAFGMRLTGVSSATGTVVDARETAVGTTTEGSVDVATLADGESVTMSFEMPDGSSATVTMIASSAVPLPTSDAESTYYFATGNAAGFQATLDTGLQNIVDTKMIGASSMAAANDFFDGPAPKIADGGAAATGYTFASGQVVSWYRGEDAVRSVNGPATAPAVDSLKPGDVGDDGNAPPATGETWLVGAGAVGDWAGHDGEVATFNGETWEFTKPENGLRFIDSAGDMRVYDTSTATWRNDGRAPEQTSARDSVRSKVDDNYYISIGARASESGTRDALKLTALLAAADYDPALPQNYRQVAGAAYKAQAGALDDLIAQRANIGVTEERLGKLEESHLDLRTVLNAQIVNVEGVDEYELSTKLQDLMARLEASYQITSRLSSLSLTAYL